MQRYVLLSFTIPPFSPSLIYNHYSSITNHLTSIFQLGEFVQDFVELRRDYDSWAVPGRSGAGGGDGSGGVTFEPGNGTVVEKQPVTGNGAATDKPAHHHPVDDGEHPHAHLVAAGDRHGIPDTGPH